MVPVEDIPEAARLAKLEFDRQAPYLYDGKTPPEIVTSGPDIFDLRERFLEAKESAVTTGKLSPKTFPQYKRAADKLLLFFGEDRPLASLGPADFTLLYRHLDKAQHPVSLANEIRSIRIVLKYAFDSELIDKPFRFGPDFKAPGPEIIRRAEQSHQRQHGKRMFEAAQVRVMLESLGGRGEYALPLTAANVALRAMILLGLNGGLGQSDIGNLEKSHIDLQRGWLDFPRMKTAVERQIPLWPETVEAIRAALEVRRKPKSQADAQCVFLTRFGRRWVTVTPTGGVTDTVGKCFSRLLTHLEMKRVRLSFYALRHATETIGGRCRDQVAVNWIMGHAPKSGDMSARYREGIDDDRLLAVTNTIREWLFQSDAKAISPCGPR
jgi:integrase